MSVEQLLQDLSKNASIALYNLQGQLFIKQPLTESKTELTISSLNSRVYFIKLYYADKKLVSKFIKD
jgi:hypothetical protein